LPLYRLEGTFKRFGVELSRSTMCDWMAVIAALLAPIVKLTLSKILTSEVAQNDYTPEPVQDPDGKGIKTGRFLVSVGDHDQPYVVCDYTPDRSRAGPEEIFKDFKGDHQADAYSAYDSLYRSGDIVEVGCMMHARRMFYEARTSDPEGSLRALAWISLLYDVEREAKEHQAQGHEAFVAARYALRSERSRPILDQLPAWLQAEAPQVLPKSQIGEARRYALNYWAALTRPVEAGFLELDNEACERALKPVAIGRRNWLFAGIDKGSHTAALLMNMCTTCKNLRIDPQAYLRDVLDRISTHPARRVEELLPDRWQALRKAAGTNKD
jgi:transposase